MEESITKGLNSISFLPYMLALIIILLTINFKDDKKTVKALDVISALTLLLGVLFYLSFHYYLGYSKIHLSTDILVSGSVLLGISSSLKRKFKEKI